MIQPGANSRVTDFARSTGQQCFTSVHCLQICSTAKFCAVVIIAKLMRLIYVFFDQRLNLFMLYIVNCLLLHFVLSSRWQCAQMVTYVVPNAKCAVF